MRRVLLALAALLAGAALPARGQESPRPLPVYLEDDHAGTLDFLARTLDHSVGNLWFAGQWPVAGRTAGIAWLGIDDAGRVVGARVERMGPQHCLGPCR